MAEDERRSRRRPAAVRAGAEARPRQHPRPRAPRSLGAGGREHAGGAARRPAHRDRPLLGAAPPAVPGRPAGACLGAGGLVERSALGPDGEHLPLLRPDRRGCRAGTGRGADPYPSMGAVAAPPASGRRARPPAVPRTMATSRATTWGRAGRTLASSSRISPSPSRRRAPATRCRCPASRRRCSRPGRGAWPHTPLARSPSRRPSPLPHKRPSSGRRPGGRLLSARSTPRRRRRHGWSRRAPPAPSRYLRRLPRSTERPRPVRSVRRPDRGRRRLPFRSPRASPRRG